MDDSHVSYRRIGITVILGVAAIVATLIYLGGIRGHSDEFFVETYYDKPVTGLSVGSPVNFRGVKVGEVREISFVGVKYDASGISSGMIYILMALNGKMLGLGNQERSRFVEFIQLSVQRGLRATVTSNGITGLSRVELDVHENAEKVGKIDWRPEYPFVPSKPSLLESFSHSATKVMNHINKMDISGVWSNINATVTSLAQLSDTVKVMMETRQDDADKIVGNLTETTTALRDLALELRANPSLLIRERIPQPIPETAR